MQHAFGFRPYMFDVFGNGRTEPLQEIKTKATEVCLTQVSGPLIRHVRSRCGLAFFETRYRLKRWSLAGGRVPSWSLRNMAGNFVQLLKRPRRYVRYRKGRCTPSKEYANLRDCPKYELLCWPAKLGRPVNIESQVLSHYPNQLVCLGQVPDGTAFRGGRGRV